MNKLVSCGLVGLMVGCMSLAQAQSGAYRPDTTLSYDVFLDQCINFKSMQRQEVWVVFFWASWNTPSIFALDPLKSTYNLYKEKPVRFVGASVDKIRSRWEAALMREQMPWEHVLINNETDYDFIKRAFRHNSLPAIFLVNSQGKIRRMADTQELKSELFLATRHLPDQPYRKPSSSIIEDLTETAAKEDIIIIPPPGETKSETTAESQPQLPEAKVEAGWLTHKVKYGDTLFSLYRRYGVKVAEIKRINGLRSNTIRTGQVLRIKWVSG